VIQFAKRRRYLFTGWFWYLGMLIPVIGIIQVGLQGYADRYTYVSYIGLFIMIAWGLPQLLSKWLHQKIVLGVLMVVVLTSLGISAHRQTSYWKNSFTLFSHALAVTQNNYIAYNNLGVAYSGRSRWTEAIDVYNQAIRIKPDYEAAYLNLGVAYSGLGRWQVAIEAYKQAIRISPDFEDAHYKLGVAYVVVGDKNSAMAELDILKSLNSRFVNDLLGQINK
jgi:tetratricopeptide (TPR) repeat protein